METCKLPSSSSDSAAATTLPGASASSQMSDSDWEKKINSVMGEKTWRSYTAQSEIEVYAETMLFRYLSTTKQWGKIDDAWQASLMPEGQLIFDTVEKKSFFVVRTFSKGFLVWFAHEIDKGLWSYDMNAEKLEWRFALKLERYKAVPTKVCSPLSLRLQVSSCKHMNYIDRNNFTLLGCPDAFRVYSLCKTHTREYKRFRVLRDFAPLLARRHVNSTSFHWSPQT
jgi:hypothetical protein